MHFCCWQTGYVTLFATFFKSYDLPSHQLNSKKNELFLSSKTIFRLWNCFLSSVATGGKDGHWLKLGDVGPTFSSFNHAMPQCKKLKTKTLLWLALSDKFVWYLFSVGKGREILCHLSLPKGPKKANRWKLWLYKVEKTLSFLCLIPIQKTVHLKQLKEMQSSKKGGWKGYHLSIENIRKRHLFRETWYIKG